MSSTARLARGLSALALLFAFALGPSPAAAASCFGASHKASLTSGGVSPSSGDTSTVFKFKVRYSDNAHCVPASVTVSLPGVGSFAMAAQGGSSTSYQSETKLPAGNFAYTFTAVTGEGKGYSVVSLSSTASVKVTPPAPNPTANPKPTAAPTVAPTVAATPVPPAPVAAVVTAAPATPAPVAVVVASPSVASQPSAPTNAQQSPRASAPGVSRGTTGGTPPPVAPSLGATSDDLSVPWLLAWLAATSGGLAFFVAMGRGAGMPAPMAAGGPSDPEPPAQAPPSAGGPPAPRRRSQAGDESQIPRWLRPSVQAARYRTPGRPLPGE
jgi:hypothetical protein